MSVVHLNKIQPIIQSQVNKSLHLIREGHNKLRLRDPQGLQAVKVLHLNVLISGLFVTIIPPSKSLCLHTVFVVNYFHSLPLNLIRYRLMYMSISQFALN